MSPTPAFVVDTGDVTEAGRTEEYARFREGVSQTDVPFYCAPGNHDVRWSPTGKEGFAQAFKQLYQSFDRGGVHFVILDSTMLLEHWGHIDTAELKWLETDLKKLKRGVPVLLFMHHWVGRAPKIVDNEEELSRLIAPYNVRAIFVGHGHSDIQWKYNSIPCFMVRGLYQGSYSVVDVDSEKIHVKRIRKENPTRTPIEIAAIPRIAPMDYRHVEFLWNDPNIPMLERRRPLAELRIGKAGAHDDRVKAQYCIDNGTALPMDRDDRDHDSVSFRTEFLTKPLSPGYHELKITLTDFDGEPYTRVEPFCVERLKDTPLNAWDNAFKTGGPTQSSPIAKDGLVFVTCLDGRLYAIDAKSGKQKFATTAVGSFVGSPIVNEGSVFAGNTNHYLYCYDARTGKEKWKYDCGTSIFSTPAIQDGIVCVGVDKKIIGLDAKLGTYIWSQDAGSFFQSRATASQGVFYLGGWDNTVYAIAASDGAIRWKSRIGRSHSGKGALSFYYSPAIASPIVGEGLIYICTNDGTLHALKAANGEDEWTARAPAGRDSLGYSSPTLADGVIYVGGLGKNGDCYAFNASNGSLIWQCQTSSENYDCGPTITDNHSIIGSVEGMVTWINRKTGKIDFQYHLEPGFMFTNSASLGKTTYFTGMNNRVQAITIP